MTERLTINRKFHVATKRCGTEQIQSGAMPVTPTESVPRISRLLALAHHCFRLVQTGAIINQSELAHFGQISTTPMTQIMWLDNLAPDIQDEILFLPRTTQAAIRSKKPTFAQSPRRATETSNGKCGRG